MRTLTLRLFICLFLATRVVATPISYVQVAQRSEQGQQQADAKKTDPQQPAGKIPEGGEKPEFVRLIDGRVVPYGPGIICSDECIQSDALAISDETISRLPTHVLNPWLFSVPLAGGIIICAVLCRGGGTPTIVSGSSRDITPTPTPAADVPEPATLVLLGLGLAMVARHGLGRKKSPDSEK